jgi:hypothetical protein
MHLARLSLGLTAAAFGGFGTWLLFRPQALSAVGIELPTPAARAEIRAFYGGLELGMALFFAAAAQRPEWHRPALIAQAASLGGSALGRVFSMGTDPTTNPLIRLLTILESAGCAMGLAALAQTDQPATSGTTTSGPSRPT